MRRVMGIALLVAGALTGACANPGAPSDPMESWARLHAHETCVYRDGKPTLIAIGTQSPTDAIANISNCNPAE